MINLRGRLVIPTAPSPAAVHAHYRSLIAAERHAMTVFRIDPELMIVVAAGRSFDRNKSLAAVCGHVCGRVDHIGTIGICRINTDAFEVPATPPEPVFGVHQLPRRAGVVGNIDATAGLGWSGTGPGSRPAQRWSDPCANIVNHCPKTIRITGRYRDPNFTHELIRGQP